jgi:hypothetical protein
MAAESTADIENDRDGPKWLALVRSQVRGLRYGVVQLVVHDGRVTQIERTEKVRLGPDATDRPSR